MGETASGGKEDRRGDVSRLGSGENVSSGDSSGFPDPNNGATEGLLPGCPSPEGNSGVVSVFANSYSLF